MISSVLKSVQILKVVKFILVYRNTGCSLNLNTAAYTVYGGRNEDMSESNDYVLIFHKSESENISLIIKEETLLIKHQGSYTFLPTNFHDFSMTFVTIYMT